jgi:hypothetical protein
MTTTTTTTRHEVTDVEIDADGTALRGWLYRPASPAGAHRRVPLVIMAHGCTAVKEMYLDRFAEVFADAGLGVLAFDHRNLGASGGEPRQEVDPWRSMRDYRAVVTWARHRDDVDPDRIALWGMSFGGGLVIVAGALDRRVRCVVSMVPVLHPPPLDGVGPELQALYVRDREGRGRGAPPMTVPVTTPDPARLALLRQPDAWAFGEHARARAPSWQNAITLRSLELFNEWDPASYVARLAPTPLMMLVAEEDSVMPLAASLDVFARAGEPRALVRLEGGHFESYDPDWPRGRSGFARASSAAREFLCRHLLAGAEHAAA